MIKAIYRKPIDNIIVKGKPFPVPSGTRQWCPLSSLLFNEDLKFLNQSNKRGIRKKKDHKLERKYLNHPIHSYTKNSLKTPPKNS
jgi:hypothetical protein